MKEDVVIRVNHVSKNFILPHEKVTSVKSAFTHLYRRRNKSREVQHALQDVSFDIKKGEFFGIVGRNGSGKSTLLKILAGIYQPSNGNVTVKGKLVPFIELGVGFNPELTGRENVYLNGAMLGFSEKEVDAMYEDIVSFAELERFMDQKLKNYSSGMQVRLAFSMATRSEADILLIDEVLAVGDADFQRKCFEYFKKLKKDKKTVVFVSHDMEAVREYCDKAILINQGTVAHRGTSDAVAEEYVKLFNPAAGDDIQNAHHDTDKRWGDFKMKFIKIKSKATNDHLQITCNILVQEELPSPIIGFRIRNTEGEHITGTNSKIEHIPINGLHKGQKFEVVWTLPNIFSEGTYTLDPAILHDDGITVADWWDDATAFTIHKNRRLPYVVDPGFKLEIRNG